MYRLDLYPVYIFYCMKRNILIYVCAFLAAITLLYFYYIRDYKHCEYQEELFTIWVGLLGFSVGGITNYCIENQKLLITTFRCTCTFVRTEKVYVSLSYLCKIKIEGYNKYLLVRGGKIQHQYQSVGGVYKKYDTAKKVFQDWNAKTKDDINNPDDLRFFVLGKHIPSVIAWFNSRKNREVDIWREFYEELIKTGILNSEIFCHVKAEYINTSPQYLIVRDPFKCKQVLIYDIYEVNLTRSQQNALVQLYNDKPFSEEYAFVSEEDIDKSCFVVNGVEYKIGNHTKHII